MVHAEHDRQKALNGPGKSGDPVSTWQRGLREEPMLRLSKPRAGTWPGNKERQEKKTKKTWQFSKTGLSGISMRSK